MTAKTRAPLVSSNFTYWRHDCGQVGPGEAERIFYETDGSGVVTRRMELTGDGNLICLIPPDDVHEKPALPADEITRAEFTCRWRDEMGY